ncbi:MAG: type II/IV secretion system protein, partial [Candidatus Thioglobus sp.]|nr:type II/IV secretion system protein [Candidatus Thioglobus sp.]
IVLVTGPTGSGKTTTLYAALSILNKTKRNIMTVEDPIEYHIDGINQTQINSKINMTFAKGLRAILRQDPDVVMVGEIRDNETAKIAIQASLTGHLVLSTLHTNSTINTVTRLIDMDIEPFLLASTLEAVLAQRLIRKLCDCKTKILIDDAKQMEILNIDKPLEICQSQGCEKCGYQGYNGRIGLYELLIIDDDLRSAITRSANEQEIKQIASKNLITLKTQAIQLVLDGKTGLDEAFRVVLV